MGYYKRFIKDFADICEPLYKLISVRTPQKLQWTEQHQRCFEMLKEKLMSAPVMSYPTETGRYILDTDASGVAIGAVLHQEQMDSNTGEVELKVIAYASRVLKDRETRYCARRRELLAIVDFVKHFRCYLYGQPEFTVRTDHASLRYRDRLNDPHVQFTRWLQFLQEYNFAIEVRKGKDHGNADGLSRLGPFKPCREEKGVNEKGKYIIKNCICEGVRRLESGEAITPVNQDDCASGRILTSVEIAKMWTPEEIREAQLNDNDIAPILLRKEANENKPEWSIISHNSKTLKAYWGEWDRLEVKNGCLYRKWVSNSGKYHRMQLVVPFVNQQVIIKHNHDNKATAHLGRTRTIKRIQQRYYWHRMKETIGRYIRYCDRCQRRKRTNVPLKAPSQTYVIGAPMERVCIDVCGPFKTTTAGNKYILVIADYFSKWAQAYPMRNQLAKTVTDIFINKWVTIWGAPTYLHSDRGTNFTSHIF